MTTDAAYLGIHEKMYSPEYLSGIDLFNAGDYFGCHEVLEGIWLVSCGQEKLFYQCLIMAAVAFYHYDAGRFGAARTMHGKARERLAQVPDQYMSLDVRTFERQLEEFFCFTVEEARAGRHQPATRPKIRLVVHPTKVKHR